MNGFNGKFGEAILRDLAVTAEELKLWIIVADTNGEQFIGRPYDANWEHVWRTGEGSMVLKPAYAHQLVMTPQGAVQRQMMPPRALIGVKSVNLRIDKLVQIVPLAECFDVELDMLAKQINETEKNIADRRMKMSGLVMPNIVPAGR